MRRALVSLGSCGIAAGGKRVQRALAEAVARRDLDVELGSTGCLGMCFREVIVRFESPELGVCIYGDVTPDRVQALVDSHFLRHEANQDLLIEDGKRCNEAEFLSNQDRIVLRRCGSIDPESLDDYLASGGYRGLDRALAMAGPEEVIACVEASGLRGRGGAGFGTGRKWRLARQAEETHRFVVCNADEGDPGAFMDRNVIEGDPFAVLEGMTIAAFAVGARQGFVYVRDEYPLAVARLQRAVAAARERGYLGERILGHDVAFDVTIRRGAGAFVCGEETALIASLEGRRGTPKRRPPFPVERGYQGFPTVINNVETLANVAWILAEGPQAFHRPANRNDRGTKVFSLAGDVRRTGLVEVPMGVTLRQVVVDIGGGSASARPLKAVQIGGPSGGCLPVELWDTPIEYQTLAETGAILGSGGVVVMDASRCMVDVARYFLHFTQQESCGKCTFCRVGTKRMLEILERLCEGAGRDGDLERLETLAGQVGAASLCGLGRSAPNPVLSTLRYFRHEYEAHLYRRCCPAGHCRELITYSIDPHNCEGCNGCRVQCAVGAIAADPRVIPLRIDKDVCARCGGCFETCEFGAVRVQ